jgi:tetratricopeptide (TPR) repeat protein
MKGYLWYRLSSVAVSLALVISLGCMSWEPGWKQIEKPSMKGDVNALFARVERLKGQADTKEKLSDLIQAYRDIIKVDPQNYEALWSVARYYHLTAMAYSPTKAELRSNALEAIKYSEQAMYTNKDFKARVDGGETVWDATAVLSKREMGAIYYLYVPAGTYWTEGLSWMGKLANLGLPSKAKILLTRMMETDPEWNGGHPYFSWAVYYARLPRILGGDLKKSAEYFEKGISIGPDYLMHRWARAKYLHTRTKDREAFKADLNWVISRDPSREGNPYPWNVYFQRDAKEMLAHINDYF